MNTSEAVELAGSVRKLAKVLGISTQAIYNWGGTVPELRVYQLRDRMALQYPSSPAPMPASSPSLAPPGD
jgi:hypothetical protein